jgi:hypothetical protein
MSIEGIWTGEVYGPFGWENRGVFLFEDGRMIGGDGRAYSVGTYSVSGDRITAELKVHYYGPPRTVYGEQSEEFTLKLDGKLEDDVIVGNVHRPDKAQFELQYRITKRMGLPAA